MNISTLASPVGPIWVATDADGNLTAVRFGEPPVPVPASVASDTAARQLREYFAGKRTDFDLPLAQTAGTPFQRMVWAALTGIGFGETWSYGRLAAHIGQPTASRAVGLANSRNPIAIVVPCHRVIGASGALTGYAGGMERKRWLLDHERTEQPALA
ncbi:methylated-DNA--[protein]-cysteine S-methyltransferase [Micropruina sonneratiae]|uniref:methylated-DNA--[protein]-cysteine S-methyltransferase n=1 Tax=Micropruina sonneratiae TaxID=2986940 RepID=UPI0029D40E91|nr:methylated-DNA--[protein]-cysteine S-methyltransferase [Micropruina sp. KQZ13P-5]